MLLPLKANRCLFPSQLASSLTFVTEALQLPGIEATCRSASVKAVHLLRVIPCNISSYVLVQAHFTAAVGLQLFVSCVLAKSGIAFCPFPPKLCHYFIFHGFTLGSDSPALGTNPWGLWCECSSGLMAVASPQDHSSSSLPQGQHCKFWSWGVNSCTK